MWIKKLVVSAAAFAGVVFAAGEAEAAPSYACLVRYIPGNTVQGSEGYISFNTHSGPNCTGSSLGNHQLCTTGATSASCTNNLAYRYERHGLLAILQSLQRAADTAQPIGVSTSTCNGGGSGCATFVSFEFP